MSLFVCVFVSLPIHPYVYLFSSCLSVFVCVCVSVCLTVFCCLPVNPFICLSPYLSVFLSVVLFVCLLVYLPISAVCLLVSLSLFWCVYLSIFLSLPSVSLFLSLCFCRSFGVSTCLSFYPCCLSPCSLYVRLSFFVFVCLCCSCCPSGTKEVSSKQVILTLNDN